MSVISHSSTGVRPAAPLSLKRLTSFFAAILGAALLSGPASAQTFTPTAYSLGGTNSGAGFSIIPGDFNNDGILDLITINQYNVAFYKGLGKGQFAAPVFETLATNNGPGGPSFAADFNQDGKLDIAASYGDGGGSSVIILLGNGDGTFTEGNSIAVSGNAAAIALADFNGDHKPDIAVSDGLSNKTWVYLGNGNGTFTLSATEPFGGNSLVAGDFNADGKQDLAFASGAGTGGNTVGMFLGNGNGTFQSAITQTLDGATSLAVGDFYNNRIQSLAVLWGTGIEEDNSVVTYISTIRYSSGAMIVENQNQISGPNAQGPSYIAGGDLNGDFKFDLFVSGGGYYSQPISEFMLGNGNGTFQAPKNAGYTGSLAGLQFPIIRDLNVDSRHDVAMAYFNIPDDSGGAEVLINSKSASNCSPPAANKLSVRICAPSNGETVPATFTFKAGGNAFNGFAKRMELWIDNKKVGQNLEDQLNVTATVTAGKHTAAFVVVDSFDDYTASTVTFTAQ